MKVTNKLARALTYKNKGFVKFSNCMIYLMAGAQTLDVRNKDSKL